MANESLKIFDIIKADLYRYDKERNIVKGLIRNLGFRYTFLLRLTSRSKGIIFIFLKILLRRMTIKLGYEISEKTRIGNGLALMHLGGISINHNCKIGRNCTIYQGVTIGGDVGNRKGYPKIGNRVWIGPNAVIVGNLEIGNNVLIAGNSFVNKSVPDNSLVIGNPAIIRKWDRIEEYIEHTYYNNDGDF